MAVFCIIEPVDGRSDLYISFFWITYEVCLLLVSILCFTKTFLLGSPVGWMFFVKMHLLAGSFNLYISIFYFILHCAMIYDYRDISYFYCRLNFLHFYKTILLCIHTV